MKTNDNSKGGSLKPEYYGAFAEYFVKYIDGMKAEGITIHAITVENEPLNPKNTPSMVCWQEEEHSLRSILVPHLERPESKQDRVIRPQSRCDLVPSVDFEGSGGQSICAGTAFHLYGGDSSALTDVHNAYPNRICT